MSEKEKPQENKKEENSKSLVPSSEPKNGESTPNPLKLERLPEHIKKDLHKLISEGHGASNIRTIITSRYSKDPAWVEASLASYKSYMERFGETLQKQKELEKKLIDSSKEGMTEIKTLIDKSEDSSAVDNKKEALKSLYAKCEARIALIESRQYNWMDAHFEALLVALYKEQRTIIEKLTTLSEELNADNTKQIMSEFESYTRVILTVVFTCFQRTSGKEKMSEFRSAVSLDLQQALKNYDAAKKRLDK